MEAWAPQSPSVNVSANGLSTLSGCQQLLHDVLDTPPSQIHRFDLGLLNLLCAPTLPRSEDLDLPKCLARLDRLTDQARAFTEQRVHRFHDDPAFGHSEAMWRMAALVTFAKYHFGAAYHPTARDDLLAGIDAPLTDSREVFIHGLLDDDRQRRWGTCASIPVLITAVARRLGYPVGLAAARQHVYCRWLGRGEAFNVEASNPGGMVVHPDDYYRARRGGLTPEQERSGYYLRTLAPAEEFAEFLQVRVWALHDAARYAETLLWSARALQLAPDDPRFPYTAYACLELTLKHRLRIRHPEVRIQSEAFVFNGGELLAPNERSLFFSIVAHYREAEGQIEEARKAYEDACRHNFNGMHEQRDLQRFRRKHGLPPRKGTQYWPAHTGLSRWIKLQCAPQDEENYLVRVVNQSMREGRVLLARDALRDLYLFDPGNAELFQRARDLERHPLFQPQLKAYIEQRNRTQNA